MASLWVWLGEGPNRYRFYSSASRTQVSLAGNWQNVLLPPSLSALSSVTALHAVHASIPLSPLLREQVRFWTALGVESDLWVWRLDHEPVRFPKPLSQKDVCPYTKAGRVYRLVSDGRMLLTVLQSQMLEEYGEETLPDWVLAFLEGKLLAPKVLLTLPLLFAKEICVSAVGSQFVLPGPFGQGPFRAPLTVQRMVHPELEEFISIAGLPRGIDAGAPCWRVVPEPFTISMSQALADAMRGLLPGQSEHVVSELAPWIMRLQEAADAGKPPLLHSARGLETVIKYVMLCDLGRSSEELKDCTYFIKY